jgi:V8-like Glu-specific endopeptidase
MFGIRRPAPALALLASLAGCSKDSSPDVRLPSFTDVASAPAVIQVAARAVVRIQTAGELATGSFISPMGLLLTNNHVLGVDICPKEGCFAQITEMHQRGAPLQQPQTVFAVPKAVDVGLDMAVVQLYSYAGGAQGPELETPSYLELDSQSPSALQGKNINVVGHPEGHLKKWTQGQVIDSDGSWISTTAYILPGDSGSPLLDDAGHLVGLMHRGPTSQDLVSADGVDEYSIAAMGAPLPAAMRSTADAVTDDDVVQYQDVYRNAQTANAMVGGVAKPVLTSLGAACDTGLARDDYASPEDLTDALAPCLDAAAWIECRSDAPAGSFGVCPMDADAWRQRYQAVNDHWRTLNGQMQLDALTFGLAALSSSMADGIAAGGQSLQTALAAARPPLDFGIANYLAAFQVGSYAGVRTLDYVRGYASVPGYVLSATDIASAALWLNHAGGLTGSDTTSLLRALDGNLGVDIGSKLYVEDVLYQSGTL